MRCVLVTGATGFVGRACVPLLVSRGWEVHALSRSPEQKIGMESVQWHQADLFNTSQCRKLIEAIAPSHWLHLAWCATVPGQFWKSDENFAQVQAALAFFDTFTQCGGRRAVLAGTCAEYDWHFSPCDEETTPLRPATIYGICKHSLHAMLDSWAQKRDVELAWGRLFYLYGPGEHPQKLVAALCRALLEGKRFECSSGALVRDYLHIEDAAAAFGALLESEATGAFNIASGQGVALEDIALCLGDIAGRRDLLDFTDTSPADVPRIVASVRRLLHKTNWAPNYDLSSGLHQTFDWWRTQGAQADRNRQRL